MSEEIMTQEGREKIIIDELLSAAEQSDTHALLDFISRNVISHYPYRLRHHVALYDPTLSLANLKSSDKRRILALRNLLLIFEKARRFWFELENDVDFYINTLQEEISLLNQLSRGDGTMLYVIRSTFKEVGVVQSSNKEEKKSLLSRLFRR